MYTCIEQKRKRKNGLVWSRVAGLIAVMIFFSFLQASATAELQQKVIVGYPILEGVNEIDAEGDYRGYNYEYLKDIAGYSGWEYEFVEDTWDNCVKGLKNGTIDMMGFVSQSARAEEFQYSRIAAGVANVIIAADENNTKLQYMDLAGINECKIGVLQGSQREILLDTFCREKNILLEKVYFNTEEYMLRALEAKNIDLIFSTNFEVGMGTKLIAEISADPFYFAVSKDSPNGERIIKTLDNAMNKILLMQPEYNEKLENGYIYGEIKKMLNLTKEESEFVKHSEPIKVVYDANWPPMTYYDEKTGKIAGTIVYLFDKIEKSTGLKFEFIKADNYSEALELIKRGDADIINNVIKDYTWAEKYNLRLTPTYATLSIDYVSNEAADTDTLVMPRNYIPYHKAKQLEGRYSVQYVDTLEECYDLIKQGKAKGTFTNSYVNNYMLGKREYKGLTTVSSVESSTELCIGIYREAPKELISIMNKVMLNMTDEEVNHFAMVATLEMEDDALGDWLYRNPATGLGVASVCMSIVLLGMLIYARERRIREKAMRYNLITGTWNFSKFITEANKKLKNYNGEEKYVILHMDICKFKFLNDNYGFETGDIVLKTMATCIGRGMKRGEIYGSLWADHFVCLLKCKEEDELYERGYCLLEHVNEKLSELGDFRLTVKAGAYCITPEDIQEGKDANRMIQYANHALATIKESYKNTMVFFNNDLKKEVDNVRFVNQDMVNAFYDRQFVPYYQPKFNIFTNEMIGAEALVRWKHPEKGLMQPGDFLPYFERSGFIVEVDLYVFEETCKNIKRWIDAGKEPIVVSCNFSRLHVENPTFVEQVKAIVNKYNIPCELLELELTETIAVEEMEGIMQQINDLHEVGFYVSIDDFGSGYSSLSVLQQLRVDTIKLDRTFLKNGIPTERECRVMESIVNLAEQLQMKVICEGVETLEQVELLKQTHCVAAQGFYFAKPMPVEELEKLIPMRKKI